MSEIRDRYTGHRPQGEFMDTELKPGAWVAHADTIPQNCPCMLVVDVAYDGRYLCRFIREDSDDVAPVTVEGSKWLLAFCHGYFGSFHREQLVQIPARRDAWPS